MPFPIRFVHLRTVNPTATPPTDFSSTYGMSLWRIALAASQETLQTGLLTTAWTHLFIDQLSRADTFWLRWQDMGNSAEIRRAQSALYGRYVARAILGSKTTARYFVPLNRNNTHLPNGVTVERNLSGDIPDWIAWSSSQGSYILGEAKGVLSAPFHTFDTPNEPNSVTNGKAQFNRVAVRDSAREPLATTNWVVANLWATDRKTHEPRIILWDPEKEGRTLTPDELPVFRQATGAAWLRSIATGLAQPSLRRATQVEEQQQPFFKVTTRPDPADLIYEVMDATDRLNGDFDVDKPTGTPHEGSYTLTYAGPLGLRPIHTIKELKSLKRTLGSKRPIVVIAISQRAIKSPGLLDEDWLGQAGIVSSDGSALFDLREVHVSDISNEM